MTNILDLIMASTQTMKPKEKEAFHELRKQKISSALKGETEAVRVIKDKIKHYKETGNARKLDIYQRKLQQKYSIISKIKSWMK